MLASIVPARPKHKPAAAGAALYRCPRCKRTFTRKNQRHACGTGDGQDVLRDRPEALVELYRALEVYARSLGPIEIVARERYVLLRSVRIFADLVVMSDALRLAVHVQREIDDPIFFKVVRDRKKVTHVAKLRTRADLEAIEGYLAEAYRVSLPG